MKKLLLSCFLLALLLAGARPATAQELQVFAARDFAAALKEIGAQFHGQTGFAVDFHWGDSTALAEKIIRTDRLPDVFFPASEAAMQLVVQKGLVDVALKRNILVVPAAVPATDETSPEMDYTSAAVLLDAANRLQAMAFLEFLVSEAAQTVFARYGFALP